NLYMSYQINEMEHLYNLFQDDFFFHQLMIWSSFAHNKPNKGNLYKRSGFNYSIPASIIKSNNLSPLIKVDTVATFTEQNMKSIHFKREKQLNKYLLKGKNPNRNYSKSRFSLFDFKHDTITKLMEIVSIPEFEEYKIGTFHNGKFKALDYKIIHQKNDTFLVLMNEETKINNLIYNNPKLSSEIKNFRLRYLLNYSEKSIPYFAHIKSEIFQLNKDDELKIAADYKNAKQMRIFFRVSVTRQDISKKIWKADNVMNDTLFKMPYDGYCQFLISFDIENPFFQLFGINYTEPVPSLVSD
ncbi:MAG: hypothetical protein PHH93_06165, partial [Prolixibacteraceae bacterium]|nr:hypothetical protein [Prolixibacteraceae bacterium]